MKEYDDTETPKINECEDCDRLAHHVNKVADQLRAHALVCEERILALEKEVTLLLEQRETARSPEGGEVDPEWYGGC